MSTDFHDFAAAYADGNLRTVDIDVGFLLRLSRFPDTEPFWGRQRTYRFDDPDQCYGATYASPTLAVAFAETVLHQRGNYVNGRWLIAHADIAARHVITYRRTHAPKLLLADLTGPHLKALGLNNDLCANDQYDKSMGVSRALHQQLPQLDGIYYVSRQMNTGTAVALFERSAVSVDTRSTPLRSHPQYGALLQMFNVAILPYHPAPSP